MEVVHSANLIGDAIVEGKNKETGQSLEKPSFIRRTNMEELFKSAQSDLEEICKLHAKDRSYVTLSMEFDKSYAGKVTPFLDWYKYTIHVGVNYKFMDFTQEFKFSYQFFTTGTTLNVEIIENGRNCSFASFDIEDYKTTQGLYEVGFRYLDSRKLETFSNYIPCCRCGTQDPYIKKFGLEEEYYIAKDVFCKNSKACKRRRRKNKGDVL